jgi:hypothetical protein
MAMMSLEKMAAALAAMSTEEKAVQSIILEGSAENHLTATP